jgi:hypothetical protein
VASVKTDLSKFFQKASKTRGLKALPLMRARITLSF